MMTGLMMSAAVAAADVPAEEKHEFGRAGSVVLGDVVAARAMTPTPIGALGGLGALGALGGVGQLSAAWFSMSSHEMSGMTVRSFSVAPSMDVFVANGVSLGALVGVGVTNVEAPNGGGFSRDPWHLTFMPRIGSSIDLAHDVAFWPRLGAGVTLFDQPGQDRLATVLRVSFVTPFVFRLSRHIALEVGPNLAYLNHLAGPVDQRGFSAGVSGGLSIVL